MKPDSRPRLKDRPYFFDGGRSCEVAYFSNESESYFQKAELTVRVGSKETESPIPLCYCFGHTMESAQAEIRATGHSTIADRIVAEVKRRNCECEIKNPAGKCCLGEVKRAVHEIQEELRRRCLLREPEHASVDGNDDGRKGTERR